VLQPYPIKELKQARRQIGKLIAEAQRNASTEDTTLQALRNQYDTLVGVINQIISLEVQETISGLEDKVNDLRAATDRLHRLGNRLEDIHSAVDVVQKVVDTAMAIVSMGGMRPPAHVPA